jgi:phosphoribosyl 1,2-cyclic phosphodiesterase
MPDYDLKLTFLGSRGNHAALSVEHQRHSALLIETDSLRIMLDCGSDWDDQVLAIEPDAIILTHGHADHAGGIRPEIQCPVIATAETWAGLAGTELRAKRIFSTGHPLQLDQVTLTPYPIAHSWRAPAVGLRIESPAGCCNYAPDIAGLQNPALLQGCSLYIGDGSTWDDSLLRQEGGNLCGHAPIPQQLEWCRQAGIAEALFTHCGEQIIKHPAEMNQRLNTRAAELGIRAAFARDGMVKHLSAG